MSDLHKSQILICVNFSGQFPEDSFWDHLQHLNTKGYLYNQWLFKLNLYSSFIAVYYSKKGNQKPLVSAAAGIGLHTPSFLNLLIQVFSWMAMWNPAILTTTLWAGPIALSFSLFISPMRDRKRDWKREEKQVPPIEFSYHDPSPILASPDHEYTHAWHTPYGPGGPSHVGSAVLPL